VHTVNLAREKMCETLQCLLLGTINSLANIEDPQGCLKASPSSPMYPKTYMAVHVAEWRGGRHKGSAAASRRLFA
jgi:hypothetical protein